jgi:tRNA G18 (ribose-2'-O)-methylase SpoU
MYNTMIRKLSYLEILDTRKTTEQFKESEHFPVSVMLNNVRSMYNVGSIFRTCDAANVKELILTGYTPYPPRIEIEKTALGASDSVTWRYDKNIIDAIKTQKEKCEKIIAVELTNNSRQYNALTKSDFPCCFVFGNELMGIDDYVLELCDDAIALPMHGVKHSLNVAVCAGIVIFEAINISAEIK